MGMPDEFPCKLAPCRLHCADHVTHFVIMRIIQALSRMQAGRILLLLNLVLWPVSAWAYGDEDWRVYVALTIAILVFSLVLIGLVWCGWWLGRKFWSAKSGDSGKPWFFLFSFSAALISVAVGVIGIFVIPEFENLYTSFGEDLPKAAGVIFSARYFLWLDIVAVAVLWWLLRNNLRRTLYFAIIFVLEQIMLFGVLSSMSVVFGGGCG